MVNRLNRCSFLVFIWVVQSLLHFSCQSSQEKELPESSLPQNIISSLTEQGSFSIEDHRYELSDIHNVYNWVLKKPDILFFDLDMSGDLEPDRFLYLLVKTGINPTEPAQKGTEYVMPKVGIQAALDSGDPWLLSAALFWARKNDIQLEAAKLFHYWDQEGSWDPVCTQQALLYFAAMEPAQLKELLNQAETSVPADLQNLPELKTDEVKLDAWMFLETGQWSTELQILSSKNGLALEVHDQTMEVIAERNLEDESQPITIKPTDNFLSFRVIDGRMHGTSLFVSGKAGTRVRMAIPVMGGI